MASPLPLRSVPMRHLLDPSADHAAFLSARQLLASGLADHGLVYLHFEPHELSNFATTVPPAFAQSRAFFASPLSEKCTAVAPALPQGVTRGYLPTAAESGGDTVESKEVFSWSVDDLPAAADPRPFEHPNVWPATHGKPALRAAFNALFDALHATMLAVARALDPLVSSQSLAQAVEDGRSVSLARAFVYHATGAARPGATGSVEHTDWGFATLLAQEAGSVALQVRHGGEWRPILGRADTLLFAAGDFLALASRGLFRSPRHRVVLTERQRLSFGFFQYPPYATALPDMRGLGGVADELSLFTDQRHGANGRLSGTRADGSPLLFGEMLAQKWQHVSRA